MNTIAANDNHPPYNFTPDPDDGDLVESMQKPPRKNGNRTFTKEGREKAAAKIRERHAGWPLVTKVLFDKRMQEQGRRYDEPGMEVSFKRSSAPASYVPARNAK